MAKKEKEIAQEPAPAEAPALEAFRSAFAAFHAGTPTRTTLDAQALAVLDELPRLCRAFTSAAGVAWLQLGRHEAPIEVVTLDVLTDVYCADTRGTITLTFNDATGAERKIPQAAIESGAIRHELTKAGEKILRTLDDAEAAGKRRLAAIADRTNAFTGSVAYWLNAPICGPLLAAFIDIDSDSAPNQRGEVFDSYRSRAYIHQNERDPNAPPALLLDDYKHWKEIARAQRAAMGAINEHENETAHAE